MKTFCIRILKTLALVFAAGLVAQTALLLLSGLALRRANAELRQAGRPLTPEELIPPEIPDSENAAWLYTSAFALLRTEGNAKTVLDLTGDSSFLWTMNRTAQSYSGNPESEYESRTLEALLQKEVIGNVLRLVEQGTARPQCRFELEYFRGATLLPTHLHGIAAVNSLLQAKALFEAHRGETEKAWQTVATEARFADALRTEPVLHSQNYRLGQLSDLADILQQVSAIALPDEDTARRIADALEIAGSPSLAQGLDFERVTRGTYHLGQTEELWELGDLLKGRGGVTVRTDPFLTLELLNPAVRQADRAALQRTLRKMAEIAERPYWETPAQMDWRMDLPKYCVFARSLATRQFELNYQVRMQAKLRVARTAFALLRHKAAFGNYPDTLAGLDAQFLDETLLDPYTGQPLVYRPESGGFVLYSLGENRTDDGGQESKDPDKDLDLVWRRAR